MDARLEPLADLFRLNRRLLENCFRDVSPEAALHRPAAEVNNMAFLAAHLVLARHSLAGMLGRQVPDPFPALADAQSLDEVEALPSIDDLLAAWDSMAGVLDEALETVSADHLAETPEIQFGMGDPTLVGAVAFLAQHESYHVGQLAYLRRLIGLEAMSYD